MRARVIYGLIGAICILACGGGEPYVPKLNGGGGGTASFNFTGGGNQTVNPGGSAAYTVTVTRTGEDNATSNPVTLSTAGLPAEATPSFTTNPVTPTNGGVDVTLNVQTTPQIGEGTYNFTIIADDGVTQKSVPSTLTVQFNTGE